MGSPFLRLVYSYTPASKENGCWEHEGAYEKLILSSCLDSLEAPLLTRTRFLLLLHRSLKLRCSTFDMLIDCYFPRDATPFQANGTDKRIT